MWIQYVTATVVLSAGAVMDIRRKAISRLLPELYLGVMIAGKVLEYLIVIGSEPTLNRLELVYKILQNTGIGMIPGILCLLISFSTRQSLGYGDSLLILICGMGIGAAECMKMLMIALLGAAGGGVLLIIAGRADRKKELPFLPFLLSGMLICIFQKL